MYIVLNIFKAVILLGGMGLTVANFIPGVTKQDKLKLRKAGKFFLITWGAVIVITVIEFTIFL